MMLANINNWFVVKWIMFDVLRDIVCIINNDGKLWMKISIMMKCSNDREMKVDYW